MRTIRNIFRRKMRAILTISGIMIGVFALIVMGAMAEKITMLVDGGTKYYGDKVTMAAGTGGTTNLSTEPLSTKTIKEVEKVDGVARASASIMLLLDTKGGSVNMGIPPMVVGVDRRNIGYEKFKLTYGQGREMKPGETGVAVVGADMVKKLNAKVGGYITVRGEQFKVVGLMDKTLTAPDSEVAVSMHDIQKLYVKQLPVMLRDKVDPATVATGLTVYVKPGQNPETVAKRINKQFPNFTATGPKAFKEQVANSTKIFTSIIFGIAMISLLVGGLSVVNTMTMAVSERTREIGIRKAIGATKRAIVRQFLAESAVIALIGGVTGLMFGALFIFAANSGNTGTPLFLLTSRLIAGSLSFALVLGVLSGLYPSYHAARLSPVAALRYE
jgi:putative ABC transport system permease protein